MEKFTVLTKIRSLSMQEIPEDERIEGIRELLDQLDEKPKRKAKASRNRLEKGGQDRGEG